LIRACRYLRRPARRKDIARWINAPILPADGAFSATARCGPCLFDSDYDRRDASAPGAPRALMESHNKRIAHDTGTGWLSRLARIRRAGPGPHLTCRNVAGATDKCGGVAFHMGRATCDRLARLVNRTRAFGGGIRAGFASRPMQCFSNIWLSCKLP